MKIKLINPNAKVPTYATDGSAAFDIYSPFDFDIDNRFPTSIKLGFATEIPVGYVGIIAPRSGLGSKYGMRLTNTIGVMDSDFRGEWGVTLASDVDLGFRKGDRILQCTIMPVAKVAFDVVDSLNDTSRGDGGFGSTGK